MKGYPAAMSRLAAIMPRDAASGAGTRDILVFGALTGAVALYYFSPWLLPAGLGAVLFLVLAWWRLDLALLFVVITAPFFRYPKRLTVDDLGAVAGVFNRSSGISFSLVEFTFLLCLGAWVIRRFLPPRGEGPASSRSLLAESPLSTLAPPAALLAASLVSLAASDYIRFSLRELRTVIIEPALFYVLLVDSVRTRSAIWRYLDVLIGVGLLVAVIAVLHYLFSGVAEKAEGVRRVLAVYHSPNHMGLFLGRVIPVGIVLAFGLRLGAGRSRLLLYIVACVVMVAVLFLTYSRGAWLAVAGALLFAALMRGRRRHLLAAAIIIAALALAFSFIPASRLASMTTFEERWYIWQATWHMVRDHPFQGVGLDNFLYHYPGYMLPQAWKEPDVSHAHNVFLDFWTRLGLLGLLVFLALQAGFWLQTLRTYRSLVRLGDDLQWPVLGLLAGMMAFLLHGLLDNSFFLIDLAFLFWLTFGLATLISKRLQSVTVGDDMVGGPAAEKQQGEGRAS